MVPFWIRVVFLLVIHSGMVASSWYLFSWRTSLLWMDVNFLYPNPCMPSWPGVFQFGTFLSVALGESKCMSNLGPSSSPCNSFFTFFIYSVFLWRSFYSYSLFRSCFVSFAFDCWFVLVHSPIGGIFFRYFGMSCFVCIA